MIDLRNLTPTQIEAYELALSAENNDFFKDKIKKFEKAQNQEFNDSMGSYRASSQEKENFQDLLSQYLIYVENTHRSFFEKGNTKANGTLKFISKDAYTNFCNWLERAGIANTKLKGFKQEFKDKVRDAIGDQRAQADRNAKKNKRRLKGLGAILAAGALGTAAIFGTKAVMEKFQNSEDDDAKTDRIEHRVKVATPTVKEKGYVQNAYEEVVIQDEVRHQTEEFRQPQQHEIIEEIVEEVAPRRVIQEPDIVIPGKVIKEPDRVIPGKVIQEPDTIVPGRVIQQPDVVVPAPTYVQPAPTTYVQPEPTVIQQQPAVTVIDNSSPVADFLGAAAGAFVGHVVADHLDGHHRGHGRSMRRSAPPPPPSHGFGGRSCAPTVRGHRQNHNVRMDRPHRQGRPHQKICAPKPYGGIANIGRPQAGGGAFFRPKTHSGGGMSGIMKRGSKHGGFGGHPRTNRSRHSGRR